MRKVYISRDKDYDKDNMRGYVYTRGEGSYYMNWKAERVSDGVFQLSCWNYERPEVTFSVDETYDGKMTCKTILNILSRYIIWE